MKTLYLTAPTFNYNLKNPNSKLLESINNNFAYNEYHTSIGDLQVDQILLIAKHFDQVNIEINGFDLDSDVYRETKILCDYLKKHNYTNSQPTNFVDNQTIYQQSSEPVLWVFGCSHSYGVGLHPNEKKYGEIVAENLNLPLKLIAKPGSSLHWSTRHLFNADIQSGDTVIWQLTTPHRVSLFDGEQVREILLAQSENRSLVDAMTDEQIYFTQISLLNFGTRYLKNLGVTFALTSIIDPKNIYPYLSEYIKYPEYCYSPEINVDLGTDNLHMGPIGHQLLAKRLTDHIQCMND